MRVTAIKTHKITKDDTDILAILDRYLDPSQAQDDQTILQENSVLAVSSKIIAICEGRIASSTIDRDELVKKEADWYLPRESNKYGVCVSIKNGMFIASAGIDASNGNGDWILWPKDPQISANTIRQHLAEKFGLKDIGVILTDSRTAPLRWGVTGVAIAHSGFSYLNSYVGKPDIFGREMHVEKVNVPDTLAVAAVGEMGEGDEQTPMAIISDVKFVQFQNRNPSPEELGALKTDRENDIYAGILTKGDWIKGENPYK